MPRADRLFALVQLLAAPGRRRLDELARDLETSPRSIYRDLADLEARGIPVERGDGTYRLAEGAAVRAVPLAPRERLLLTLALENPGIERQPAFSKELREMRTKLGAAPASRTVALLAGPDRSGAVRDDVVTAIEAAIGSSHSVSILYTSLKDARARWRGVDPWSLFHRSEAWYLVGRCHVHDEPRTFRLDRVEAVLPIGFPFERAAAFDVRQWFANSWGVETSEETHDVCILFDPDVAPLIEHGRHHPREEKRRRPDGSIEYRLRIGPLREIARWIVGFGGAATALAPRQLVEQVRAIAAGAAAAHTTKLRRSAKRAVLPKGADGN